jgi:hypothetical protein
MYAIVINNKIEVFGAIPGTWNNKEGYNYSSQADLKKDGWKEVLYPSYNPATQKLGEIYDAGDNFTYRIADKTPEEIRSEQLVRAEQLQKQSIEEFTRKQIQETAEAFDDETALDNTSLFPFWREGETVAKDAKRQDFDGNNELKLYKAIQPHTTQADWRPKDTPSLWLHVAKPGEIPEWKQPAGSHDAYQKGDRVKYNGDVWESAVNANVYAPGVVVNQWREVFD